MAPAATLTSHNDLSNGHTNRLPSRRYDIKSPPSLSAFQSLCSQSTDALNYPLATSIESNIPIYDLSAHDVSAPSSLHDEWHHILLSGPGVVVLKNFLPNHPLIKSVNTTFDSIIDSERIDSGSRGDHFAASGTNSRIWNSFQKHAMAAPSDFVQYYSNPWLAAVSEAWLGPAYRITAQVNVVRPGGKAQVSHRDYHLGFQTAEACAQYPKAMHIASQFLTLQGAIAHSDMPLDSGPTRFLPFSQQFEEGFMAYRLPDFQKFFDKHWISLPLEMGDAVFFNPALFHAAGENTTLNVERSANLLQVSSAFGNPMETVDTVAITIHCWRALQELVAEEGTVDSLRAKAAIDAVSQGYPFPTNLDMRPPAPGGMAPESERDIITRGLREGWDRDTIAQKLGAMVEESRA